MPAVHCREQSVEAGSILRRAEEQTATRSQGKVESRQNAALKVRREIDEQVPAGNQVQPGERRSLMTLCTEKTHISGSHSGSGTRNRGCEMLFQAFGGKLVLDGSGILSPACHLECHVVDVGGEDLYIDVGSMGRPELAQEHGQAVGFLTRGHAGTQIRTGPPDRRHP